MTLYEVAQIYTDLVSMDTEIPEAEYIAKDEVGALRSKYINCLWTNCGKRALITLIGLTPRTLPSG